MNRDKQIEEMAKDFCALNMPCEECHLYKNRCHAKKYATRAYNAGYRKASEVAREIFEEIDRMIYKVLNDRHYIMGDMCYEVAELKKKYAEGDNDVK